MAQRAKLGILVVDDDEDICQFLKELLERDGYHVRCVTKSPEAIPAIREGGFQIVLLDIRMPDLDGVSLLRQIRAFDSDLCVIVMTAYPSVESAVETMKADAHDYLRKPFEPQVLRQVLERAIREHGLMVNADDRLNQMIGSKIRALRREQQLTLKQLANKTGVSVSLISQIELGKSAASISTLHKLSAALGVPMSYVFEGV
jgi:DNA-binding NtrC family response regulator